MGIFNRTVANNSLSSAFLMHYFLFFLLFLFLLLFLLFLLFLYCLPPNNFLQNNAFGLTLNDVSLLSKMKVCAISQDIIKFCVF